MMQKPLPVVLSNAIAIGYGAVVNNSNTVRVGNTNVTSIDSQLLVSPPTSASKKT